MYDSCTLSCMKNVSHANINLLKNYQLNTNNYNKSHNMKEIFSCMKILCPFTEPTAFNPEWNELEKTISHPNIRLDYILMNKEFIKTEKCLFQIENFVDIKNDTSLMSDHYPVLLAYPYDDENNNLCNSTFPLY